MTRNEIIRRWPRATESTIRANLSAGDPIPHPEQRQRTEALAGRNAGETSRPGLRHCRFTLCRKQLLDVDAKYASTKDLLDCLAIAGIIRGDKEGEITLEINQRKIVKGESEGTIIEVFDLENPPLT